MRYAPEQPGKPPDKTEFVWPKGDRLLLDLDSAEQVLQFVTVGLPTLLANWKVRHIHVWASRSKGTHAMLVMAKSFTAAERVALQAALGSDPVREMISVARLRAGIEPHSTLYKPQPKRETR